MPEYKYFEDRAQGVEFRKRPGRIEFRLIYNENPASYNEVVANAELRAQGGAWAPVPSKLLKDVPDF